MTQAINASHSATVQTIMAALRACYGNLDEPDFRKVHETLRVDSYRAIVETLRENGIKVTDTTDPNDDASISLVPDRSEDQVGLSLSGVGPFAAITHQDPEGHYSWVTQSGGAPTPLAAITAQMVQEAGFKLLDRSLVSRPIAMTWHDGSTEVTLY